MGCNGACEKTFRQWLLIRSGRLNPFAELNRFPYEPLGVCSLSRGWTAIAQDWRTPAKCNYATNGIFCFRSN